jgi:hypothetical protein
MMMKTFFVGGGRSGSIIVRRRVAFMGMFFPALGPPRRGRRLLGLVVDDC